MCVRVWRRWHGARFVGSPQRAVPVPSDVGQVSMSGGPEPVVRLTRKGVITEACLTESVRCIISYSTRQRSVSAFICSALNT